ncbi:MAG TPA: hypothetical protein DCY27_09630 [Desulfobacterales bacterium]|nr:hypothetical protein [Desulfobacterales bacterium]
MTGPAVSILGVEVGCYTLTTLLTRVQELLQASGCSYIYGVNAHTLNLAAVDREFLQIVAGAEAVYADGASLLLAARVLGRHLPEKVTTTDLWPEMCQLAVEKDWKFYLLGGEPGLARRAGLQAGQQFPGLQIVGTHDGYTDIFSPQTAAAINAAQPDVLWVGMGDPLQGYWAKVMRPQLQVKVIITCGGMFKIVSGELKRLPRSWRERGFEWLYRLWQEPQAWRRYLVGLPLFGLRVLSQRLTQASNRLPGSGERHR